MGDQMSKNQKNRGIDARMEIKHFIEVSNSGEWKLVNDKIYHLLRNLEQSGKFRYLQFQNGLSKMELVCAIMEIVNNQE